MANAMIAKQRAFSSAENAVLNVSRKFCGFFRVGEILHLRGPFISLDALRTAVGCLQRRHPFLRSRLKNNPGSSNTYLMEEDSTLRLKIREIPRKRDQHLQFWKQEWREREKDIPIVGEGLAEFWLLQDPDDREDDQAPREIIIICEHCICDGLSISAIAHELLLALSEENGSMFKKSFDWPMSMETAIESTVSRLKRITILSKFLAAVTYQQMTVMRKLTRIPYENINFEVRNAHEHCHSEAFYDSLTKAESRTLFDKCHRQGVTVTSAISAAILRAMSTIVNDKNGYLAHFTTADLRRRYVPPMANNILSYQMGVTDTFYFPVNEIPTNSTEIWNLARIYGQHIKHSIDAADAFASGMITGKVYEKEEGPLNPTGVLTCGISNWGRLTFHEQYGRWKLEGITPAGNLVRSFTPLAIVFTINDVLTIGQGGPVPLFSSNILQQLQNDTMQHLREMINN